VDEAPSASERTVDPVEPLAVVILKLESFTVSARLKAISLASVVVMVLPPLYAACREIAALEHLLTLLVVLSTQSSVPVAVCSPVRVK